MILNQLFVMVRSLSVNLVMFCSCTILQPYYKQDGPRQITWPRYQMDPQRFQKQIGVVPETLLNGLAEA